MKTFLQHLVEQDPCWKGYTQVGMKKKGKRKVPNCVKNTGGTIAEPTSSGEASEQTLRSFVGTQQDLLEGSASGGNTRRNTAVGFKTTKEYGDAMDKAKGVKVDPSTDARKYTWDHQEPANKGPALSQSDIRKKMRQANKSKPAPAQHTAASNSRMTDILNHPHYKKLAAKKE